MTAFFVDLSRPRERMLIASDSLAYTIAGEHKPLGFCSKVIPFSHLRGALLGSGIYEIQVAAAAALMTRPELLSFADVVAALPEILHATTDAIAEERGIEDPSTLMLFAGGWCGFNEADRRFELVTFDNHKNYQPEHGYAGFVGIPNVPPSYVPAGFRAMRPELRAVAALRAIRRFLEEHGAEIGMAAPIGGEVVLTDLRPDGISSKVAGRFEDYHRAEDAARSTWANINEGERSYAGVDLVNAVADQPAAARAMAAIVARDAVEGASPPMTRQQRRAAARRAA